LACLATDSLGAEPPAREAPPVPPFLRVLQQAAEPRPVQPDAPGGTTSWCLPPSTSNQQFPVSGVDSLDSPARDLLASPLQ